MVQWWAAEEMNPGFYITLHCIAFLGSKVSQNDCGMWNMSYKYKNIHTVQLKFSHKITQLLHLRLFKNTAIYIHPHCQLILFTLPLNG
jgi:hypothetical protein